MAQYAPRRVMYRVNELVQARALVIRQWSRDPVAAARIDAHLIRSRHRAGQAGAVSRSSSGAVRQVLPVSERLLLGSRNRMAGRTGRSVASRGCYATLKWVGGEVAWGINRRSRTGLRLSHDETRSDLRVRDAPEYACTFKV